MTCWRRTSGYAARVSPADFSPRTSTLPDDAVAWLSRYEGGAAMSEAYAARITDASRDEAPHIRMRDDRELTPLLGK
ncbi:hypothetical protein Scel_47170 [Streptomyces cellostaticus]|nr:hypothetical protein Scel_47170 [Streptomyces cellostaticus]